MEQQIDIEPEDQHEQVDEHDEEEMEMPDGIEGDEAPQLDENGELIEGQYEDEEDEE
jgi:hypothetical protein